MRLASRWWWTLAVFACAGCAAAPREHDSLTGDWGGSAVYRGARLDFTVRFFSQDDTLRATLSSPDLLLLDAPLDSVRHEQSRVRFTTPDEHPLGFEGALQGDTIRGTARVPAVPGVIRDEERHGQTLRFALHRTPPAAAPPYTAREVRFESPGARLAGTLLVPAGAGRHPGIVILQGSSSNLRREYRFYSDLFARSGMVVLGFDKRGRGESSGDYGDATYDDLAADAAAAVEFLATRPEVAPARVGIWGLSQGAFLAPLVAARVPALAFIVTVSPPGVSTGECAAYQDSARLVAAGFPTEDAAHAATLNRRILAWLESNKGEPALAADLAAVARAPWRRASSLPARLPAPAAARGWYWRGRTLDPIPGWRALRVPVLVVFGAADELLPAGISAARIERALSQGGHRDFTVRVFPAANHVLRRLPLVSGGAWDWPRAAPGYLDLMTSWIRRHAHE